MKSIKLNQENFIKVVATTVDFLKKGETIVLPTDTVYGLACDALNEKAVEKLFLIKKRDRRKGLPVFVNSMEMARRLAYVDKRKEKFLNEIWPGQITAVLQAKDIIPKIVTGELETVALRMPDYKFITDLIKWFGGPITGTSANISGGETPGSPGNIKAQWVGKRIKPALVIDAGKLPPNPPSTILDVTGEYPIVLRKGIITKKEFDNLSLTFPTFC